eukprot:maker-scaffold498_size154992-snap-gene-0.20 protein:Tk05259 transcript:maker-scaffold498_size154992-snap-gene-0.20-mRNA-1 annotation:"heparan sulfate 2-o-sulfotransferase pipe-like"
MNLGAWCHHQKRFFGYLFFILGSALLYRKIRSHHKITGYQDFTVWKDPLWTNLAIEMKGRSHGIDGDILSPHKRPPVIRLRSMRPIKNKEPPNLLIFNKNRKCGTSTLRNIIKLVSKKQGFNVITSNKTRLPKFPYSMSKQREREFIQHLQWTQKPVAFMEHFYHVDTHYYDTTLNPIWINLVRQPVDRFVSMFFHHRKAKFWNENDMPPKGWFEKDINECILSGDPECSLRPGDHREQQITYFCGNSLECSKLGSQEALAVAMTTIEARYALVGVMEDMNATIQCLERVLPNFFGGVMDLVNDNVAEKKNIQSFYHANRNVHPKLTPEAEAKLTVGLRNDIELYQEHRDPIHQDVEVLEVCAPDFAPKHELCLGGIHDEPIARCKPSKTLCPLI